MVLFMITSLLPVFILCVIAVSCVTDLKGMKIPDIIPVLVMVGFVAFCALSGQPLSAFYDELIVGGAVFLLTFVLFCLNMFGAGDAKLATAVSFWVGVKGIGAFLFFMTVAGGLLGVAALIFMKKGVPRSWQKGWLKHLSDGRADVPYAVAIFIGAIAGFMHSGLI